MLDLGNPIIMTISKGQRVFDGLFQAIAVRAAGFQVVSVLKLAPAVQVLYTVMMYLAAFPIAMSVRSSNVYEERSLGVFADSDSDDDDPGDMPGPWSRRNDGKHGWSSYMLHHARKQLSFDLWWLAFSLWLLCIVEKHQIEREDNQSWFTVFSCLFELTSAYGTVGLSMGTPMDNFSLSGRFNVLGKLIVIAVMLRGRHRGLPVAIDRAIMLPDDLEPEPAEVYTPSLGPESDEWADDPADESDPNADEQDNDFSGRDGNARSWTNGMPPQAGVEHHDYSMEPDEAVTGYAVRTPPMSESPKGYAERDANTVSAPLEAEAETTMVDYAHMPKTRTSAIPPITLPSAGPSALDHQQTEAPLYSTLLPPSPGSSPHASVAEEGISRPQRTSG